MLFLESCVIFRFSHHETVNWISFRRWAQLNWGIPHESFLHKLGDGLWLLSCGSKTKVDRILAIKRWTFDGHPLLLDKWIPMAGRSNVLINDDIVWVTARGIPLHLRSTDLFRQLGEACGKFLGFEYGDSLSSVRLKVKLIGALPEEVPICFENTVYPVSIDREGLPISGSLPASSALVNGWRSKGKSSLLPRPSFAVDSVCSDRFVPPLPSQSVTLTDEDYSSLSAVDVASNIAETINALTVTKPSPPRSCCSFVGF
ncbi:hypothetical protein LINPERHAP1_LOCUS14992 [Linum perenne]